MMSMCVPFICEAHTQREEVSSAPAHELNGAQAAAPRAWQVAHGKGWAVVRGLPVRRWSRLQSVLALHGMGLHMGVARPQNARGHLIGGWRPRPDVRTLVQTACVPEPCACLHTQRRPFEGDRPTGSLRPHALPAMPCNVCVT